MIFTKNMQVVVLLGGRGKRLKSIGSDVPKPMIDVHGYPFFYFQLKLMVWYGFRKFLFCIGCRGEIIKNYFGDGKFMDIDIEYSNDGEKLLGTGGAIRNALELLDEDFVVMYGDSYMDVDYSELIYNYYRVKTKENKKGLMAVYRNRNQFDKSNVVFKDNKILHYDKKNPLPEMEHIDYGISILHRSTIERLPKGKFIDLSDVFHKLVKNGLMTGHVVRNRFYEIGNPHSLQEFKEFIYNRVFVKKPAIFLDRDGTINEIVFNEDIELFDSPLRVQELKLLPNAIEALQILKSLGYLLIIITNQPAAAKGKTTLGRIYEIDNALRDMLIKKNIYIDDILMCPHHPTGTPNTIEHFLIKDCESRKPGPGLLLKAMNKYNVDTDNSYVVGDSYVDILTGKTVGLKTVFLGRYKCENCQLLGGYKPDYIFMNLFEFSTYLKGGKSHERN